MRMNRSDESRQTCPFPDLRRKAFSLLPLNRILAVIFINTLYQVIEVPFYSSVLRVFLNHEKILFKKCDNHDFFFLFSLKYVELCWFCLNETCDPKINPACL